MAALAPTQAGRLRASRRDGGAPRNAGVLAGWPGGVLAAPKGGARC
jgi:hypothetical protein